MLTQGRGDRMISYTPKDNKHKIITHYFFVLFFLILLLFPKTAFSFQLSPISVNTISNKELSVDASLSVDQKFIEDLNDGMSKELIFYVDLFRVWKIWPDEFVKGKKIIRTLKSDPIKREYIAISTQGSVSVEKRFKDIESMLSWSLNLTNEKITSKRDFERGIYFVKVTAESSKKLLPPVIGYFLFFISDREFSVSRNSQPFQLTGEASK